MALRFNTFHYLHLSRMIMFYYACLGLQYKDNCTTVCQVLFTGNMYGKIVEVTLATLFPCTGKRPS